MAMELLLPVVTMQTIRKNTGSIEAPETALDPEPRHRRLGRPRVHEEDWAKVTVVLLTRQIVFLDRLAADVRSASGVVLKRAEIIRALVDALAESGFDPTQARSEADLKQQLLQRSA
jgi:hypothetical protein